MKFYPDKLIQIREHKKVSMSSLSFETGISRSSLWAWETEKRVPSPTNVRALASALEIDVSEISDLKGIKNIVYKTYSKSLQSLQELSSITRKLNPEKLNTLKSMVNLIEEELFNSSIIINSLISSLDFGFYVKDVNQKYILANKAFIKMLNLDEEFSVFGKKDTNLFPGNEASFNSSQDEYVISNGISVIDKENFLPGTRKSRWGLTSKLPIFDKNKDIIGLISVFKDTTEKRKSEQRRIALENALESVNQGVWIAEITNVEPFKLKFIYINKFFETYLGLERDRFFKDSSIWEKSMKPADIEKRKLSRRTRKFPAYYSYTMFTHDNKEMGVEEIVYKFDETHLIGIITPKSNSLD
ncbi:MAG: hypothetical protein A2X47_11830 [Lentisphaerae bacterium GWF2_38_69]|nr:MAG: hypothetical protein A2X47_11830 [Lentisphaerae bacterium GWF2_38_69]